MDDRLFDPTPTLSVSEVLGRARVVVERAFGDESWVEGEIHGLRRTDTHVYFDLVEPRPDGRVAARLPVVLFEANRRGVNALLRRAGGGVRMDDGLGVRIRGSITVYDRTGAVQLRMTAIDPNHTIGLLAAERDRVLQALSAEGLLAANGRRVLTGPPLRVTLLTSRGSAACEDFLHELDHSGLAFTVRLCDVRVQGRDAEASIVAALAAVDPATTDVVALVRGGGARTDLAAFDAEGIARAVAATPVPVVTGLGHEIDRAVADEVAHTARKTPTACAAWLVETVRAWALRADDAWAGVAETARRRLDAHEARVDRAARRAVVSTRRGLDRADQHLDDLVRDLHRQVPRALDRADERLTHWSARLSAYDPARTLARGWSITRTADGTLVRDPADAPPGTTLVTRTAGGELTSTTTDRAPSSEDDP
jgi:exodeoxyribonuclease VII large subunit